MRILLTGPRGNLGQALLKQDHESRWLTVDRGDWSDISAKVNGVDAVIHAASDLITPVGLHPSAALEANVMTLARLLEAWPANSKARFVFISSCAVYGRNQITAEQQELTPLSLNGLTKAVNERVLTEVARARGVDFQIVRLFNLFGGHDRFSILAHLKQSLVENQSFTMFNSGISQRDFVHVDDVAHILRALLKMPVRHRVLNIGSGETVRIADLVNRVKVAHPELKIAHAQRDEAEYSRADITRLREMFPDYKFRCVLDYIRAEF